MKKAKISELSSFLEQTKIINQVYKSWDNFRVFRVFDFYMKAKIRNSETSGISKFFLQNNYKSRKNFRVFRVFDFCIRVKIENSKTSEISNFISKNKNCVLLRHINLRTIFWWDYVLILQKSVNCLQRRIVEHFMLPMWTF